MSTVMASDCGFVGTLRRACCAAAATAVVAALSACGSSGSGSGSSSPAPPSPTGVACASPAVGSPASVYPLRVASGGRYLVDANGNPFLITGDTAWSLIVQLSDTDVDRYLDDRKARGFNAILVNLIDTTYATNAPANIYGTQPFVTSGDFSTPNEEYFVHADKVISKAADRGLLVLLDPAYFGYSNDGWYDTIVANGATKMEQYGRYVGHRYAKCENVMWVIGGDRTPSDPSLGDAIASGIRAEDPDALLTAHANSDASVLDIWGNSAWLMVNTVFTYEDVWSHAIDAYQRSSRPYFLIESAYENDGFNAQTPTRIRTQAYQALLAGATGQVFGNNPIWHFDGPGCCSSSQFPTTWQQAMSLEGSQSMSVLAPIFDHYAWQLLIPDATSSFVTAGVSSGQDRAAAAVASDGSFGIVYVPSARTVTIDLARLRGPADLIWVDPTDGTRQSGPSRASGTISIATPGTNAKGGQDWVLIVQG